MTFAIWLQPHKGNPFTKAFQDLITDEVPKQLDQDKQSFPPHITLTNIDNEQLGGKLPQEWLDGLELPDFKAEFNEVVVTLDTLQGGDDYLQKMNISVLDDDNLKKLAAVCKASAIGSQEKGQTWAQKEFQPSFPLLYADIPTREAQNKVALIEMKIGFSIGDIFACCGGTLCMGGHLVIAKQGSSEKQWEEVAKRETPWIMWRATHSLI